MMRILVVLGIHCLFALSSGSEGQKVPNVLVIFFRKIDLKRACEKLRVVMRHNPRGWGVGLNSCLAS